MVETARAAVAGGVTMVQLRDKAGGTAQMIATGRALKAALAGTGAKLIVNDDVAAAIAIGADGVHIGQGDMSVAETRARIGPEAILGLTVETPELAAAVDPVLANYIGAGPVFATSTKPDHKQPVGFGGLSRQIAASAPSPLSPLAVSRRSMWFWRSRRVPPALPWSRPFAVSATRKRRRGRWRMKSAPSARAPQKMEVIRGNLTGAGKPSRDRRQKSSRRTAGKTWPVGRSVRPNHPASTIRSPDAGLDRTYGSCPTGSARETRTSPSGHRCRSTRRYRPCAELASMRMPVSSKVSRSAVVSSSSASSTPPPGGAQKS